MAAPPTPGDFFAAEYPVTNLERSKKFYTDIFAFNFALEVPKGSDGIQSIHFFGNTSGSVKGALMLLDQGSTASVPGKDRWSGYSTFVVDDVTVALQKAESLGGSVRTRRIELPNNMGVVGHIADPDGNLLGVWSQK